MTAPRSRTPWSAIPPAITTTSSRTLNIVRPERAIRSVALALSAACSGSALAADETSIRLSDGPGRDQTQASCSMCHSLDYIVMNSPFQDRAAWEKTVNKMIKVFGAPLPQEDVAKVAAYLEKAY